MQLRLLDEVLDLGGRGVMLLSMDEAAASLQPASTLLDARGAAHTLHAVSEQDGVFMLHIPAGEMTYFERLFRDVRIDATLFTVKEAPACP